MKKRLVITGIGILSPAGIGKEKFWQNIERGKADFKKISLFNTDGLKVNIAGEISDFNPKEILGKTSLMDLDRATLLLSCAVKLALEDAKLEINETNTKDTGVSIGTTFGSLYSISEFDKEAIKDGPRYANPSVFPSTVANSPASRASILFKVKGYSSTISTGMCASLDALDYACDSLENNRAKTAICGAVEVLSQQIFLGFYKLNYLAGLKAGSELISCPFDKRRNGIIFSEGSAAFIVEELGAAKARRAKIYAEILGIGSSFDPVKFYNYNPKGTGMELSMKNALNDAKLEPDQIDCIFANANSTQDADLIEAKAINEGFGEYAGKIPVTAIKSIVGETYSASGDMSLVAALGSMEGGFIPPIANLIQPEPVANLNLATGRAKKAQLNRILINSFGPNGENTSLIIGRLS